MPLKPTSLVQFIIYLLGLAINAFVLVAVIRFRRELLASRLNQWAASIMLLCFLWSLTRIAISSRYLANSAPSTSASAWFGVVFNIGVQLIFFLNLCLAAERYFTIHPAGRRSFFFLASLMWVAIISVNIWAFESSPSTNGEFPTDFLQVQILTAAISIGYFVSVVLTAFFYIEIYRRTSRILNQNPSLPLLLAQQGNISESTEISLVHMKIEKLLLMQALVCASILILYGPIQIYFLGYAISGANENYISRNLDWHNGASIVVSLDAVVTPLIILYFKRDMQQRAFFWT
ncbi:hypothetical protein HDU83_008875 [Entophlyctis luteolus]|nr:hypothetical protein HDU83_008875 [Entophlyctis luteolus]KAJ3390463.1 hypothetical protein HDU84_007463 [Entophlyctis sp. JEL0112]